MNEPLFSLIILCYRKFEHLYTAIDSALLQNYPNIELIISDDGSAEFPRSDIETYISKQKSENITNVLVRQEEVNCGTVRHLNHAIAAAHGDYLVALAGDDAFYNENVLSAYVEGFSRAPENCYIEMAHTAMYDSTLTKLESYYLKPIVQKAIEKTETDSSDLLEALIKYGACMPSTSTCFKRTFFEKFGKFDEKYTLIEDYPMHIRLAEEGWIIHFENFVAIKHRNGGISHGRENTKRNRFSADDSGLHPAAYVCFKSQGPGQNTLSDKAGSFVDSADAGKNPRTDWNNLRLGASASLDIVFFYSKQHWPKS